MTKEVAKTKLKEILLEGYTLKSMIKETHIEEFIDELYDGFENRICKNCKSFKVYDKEKMSGECGDESSIAFESEKALYGDDGCNHWSER